MPNCLLLKIVALFVIITLGPGPGRAQPVLSSEQTIAGYKLYRDFKKPNLFYFAPGDLKLARETNGNPKFHLLEMRYTGTSCYADQGNKRFTNIVQFTVLMEKMEQEALKAIKNALRRQRRQLVLRPLPIRSIESFLVSPVGSSDEGSTEYLKIGEGGSFETAGAGGNSTRNAYWTERTFSLKLENYEAQLLWKQVESGKLALSLAYAFYADVIPGAMGRISVSGDRESVADFKEKFNAGDLVQPEDTSLTTQLVKANAFAISIDVEKWPEALKKVDINEEVPPAYAALEVKCFDFADGLRPDLSIKIIEIEATAVNGRLVSISTKFLRSQAELSTRNIYFPFAVRMDKPMRYRITEYTLEGDRTISEWKTKKACAGLIDITTAAGRNAIDKKSVEIEIDKEGFMEKEIKQIIFTVKYAINDRQYRQQIKLETTDLLPIAGLSFRYNKDKAVKYSLRWEYENGEIKNGEEKTLMDDYYFIGPPGS